MVGFDGRPWLAQGSNGGSYSDLAHHQTTWETNPTKATALHSVLTDYSGGNRGASLNPQQVQKEAGLFLGDLDRVYPGALAAASGSVGSFRVHLEHWPSNPLVKGSYMCNHPGYFTTIADNEAKPSATCTSRASIRARSTSFRALWKGPLCQASERRVRFSRISRSASCSNRDRAPKWICHARNA